MKKILIIEDDKIVMASAKDLLEAEGYDVATAENGRVGVEMAHRVRPDLIICDVMMPEMDGHSVLANLRKQRETNTIPFIFLTAKADKTDIRSGMKLGADDYLTKPYTRMDLLDAITSRLDKQKVYDSWLQEEKDRLNYDTVTGLPNRPLILEKLTKTIQARPAVKRAVAVLYFSLDRFSYYSDSLGPENTNQLLKTVASRLKEILGEGDCISRLQGDEFAVVLGGPLTEQEISRKCEEILEKLSPPYYIDQLEVFTPGRLGVAFYPDNATEPEGLLNNARVAMLHARKPDGNAFEFYNAEMDARSRDLLKLEADLRHALERDELEIYYQPQVSLTDGRMFGAEALLRWKHPVKGFISPLIFIPLAEETGLIHAIGDWVLMMACQTLKNWQDAGLPSLRIAVNVSSSQIYQPGFTSKVAQVVNETGISPENLELELTESTLAHEIDTARSILTQLKSLGIKIAIDDFGTGFSSLSYLKQFPFDTLKIDRIFVQNIGQDSKNSVITRATIQMAHSLSLKVIAEGVETTSELDFLRNHDCDEIQGYLFSKPLDEAGFVKLLKENKTL